MTDRKKGKCLYVRRLALAIVTLTAAANVASQPRATPELIAAASADGVVVSFELHPENYEDLALRLSHQSATTVSWVIELRRLDRLGWFDRVWATAMIRVVARPLGRDTVLISRWVNGRIQESDILVDRHGAERWLTSFSEVPLFESFQLAAAADHNLIIKATVEGGGQKTIVSSSLAGTRLRRAQE